jgi:hypothetical protein
VLFYKSRDEVIAVVVAVVIADLEIEAALGAGFLEQFGVQLLGEERVVVALVDEDRPPVPGICHRARYLAGIVFLPAHRVAAQVIAERLAPPRGIQGRGNGRERRQGPEYVRVTETDRERAMTAHGVAHESVAIRIAGKMLEDGRLQLLRHVVIHIVVPRPRFLGGVDVETGTEAEIVFTVRIVRHAVAARARVG